MRELSLIGAASPGFKKAIERDCPRWCVSTVFKKLDYPIDRIFQLHKRELWEKWIGEELGKMVLSSPYSMASVYPYKKMFDHFGPVFGSSIDYMLALAISEGYERVNIYGVNMNTKKEYIGQRDTFFYFCGRAEAEGIEIYIPKESGVFFKNKTYGV